MARHTFQYTKVAISPSAVFPQGQTALRPLMLANLRGSNENQFKCIVWLDSGADHCVFPVSFALALGLSPPFATLAGFTPGLEAQGVGLLGQTGFFERYGVTFDHKASVFHIDS